MRFVNHNEIHIYGPLFAIDTDAEQEEFKTLLRMALEADAKTIHIHLHDAPILPSPAIGQLIKHRHKDGVAFTIHLYRPEARKALCDLNMESLFTIEEH